MLINKPLKNSSSFYKTEKYSIILKKLVYCFDQSKKALRTSGFSLMIKQ